MENLLEQNHILHNLNCTSEQHGQHIYYLLSQGLNLSDGQEYVALIDNPKFMCGHCGRKANRNGNLCVPFPLHITSETNHEI